MQQNLIKRLFFIITDPIDKNTSCKMMNKTATSYVAVLIVFLLSMGFSFGYDGFALYESDFDSTIYLYDGFGNYNNFILTTDLVNENCNQFDGIFDIDGTTGDLYILSSCGKLTKMKSDKTELWSYQFETNDTKERYLKSNDNHVLITDTDNFTLLNADGSHNVTRTNNYTVFSSNVELNKDSNLLIADRNIESIIELNIIDDSFERIYSPYFMNIPFSISYDSVTEQTFIFHGDDTRSKVSTYYYIDRWENTGLIVIDNQFNTVWAIDNDDNVYSNYNLDEEVYMGCYDSFYSSSSGDRYFTNRLYSYNGKHYLLGSSLSRNTNCPQPTGSFYDEPPYPVLSTFPSELVYPLDEYSAESHYISDYRNFATELYDTSRTQSSSGQDNTFLVLDIGTSVPQLVALKEGDVTNVTIGYQTGYTSYQSVKEFETPYPIYTKDNIRIAKISNIAGIEDDDVVTGAGVSIVSNIPDQFTTVSKIHLNMSEYFFNYTDIDIEFFNSETSWLVTIDNGIDDSDKFYNDSAVNYSLRTSGSDLFFTIDPYAYYDGVHLNEEVVVQAYRNDSDDFAEQRFNLQIARDEVEVDPTREPVEQINDIKNLVVDFNQTAPLVLNEFFRNANTYVLVWYDRENGEQYILRDTVFDSEASKFDADYFSAWFSVDDLGRKTLYIRSKDELYDTGFKIEAFDYRDGFGIISESSDSFGYEINDIVMPGEDDYVGDYLDTIIPDSKDYDRKGNWLIALAFMLLSGGALYVLFDRNITGGIIGIILGFVGSLAFGYIPVVIVVFVVIGILGFIFLRMRS